MCTQVLIFVNHRSAPYAGLPVDSCVPAIDKILINQAEEWCHCLQAQLVTHNLSLLHYACAAFQEELPTKSGL